MNITESDLKGNLEVLFADHSIDEILEMTVDDAIAFLKTIKQNLSKNSILYSSWTWLCSLGQSSATLSGGEAQRIKLASFIGKGNTREKILFIFDEPTTGLHFHDINKLLASFDALIDKDILFWLLNTIWISSNVLTTLLT